MALSNAERQRRFRQRRAAKLAGEPEPEFAPGADSPEPSKPKRRGRQPVSAGRQAPKRGRKRVEFEFNAAEIEKEAKEGAGAGVVLASKQLKQRVADGAKSLNEGDIKAATLINNFLKTGQADARLQKIPQAPGPAPGNEK